jgi:hypothetical protein
MRLEQQEQNRSFGIWYMKACTFFGPASHMPKSLVVSLFFIVSILAGHLWCMKRFMKIQVQNERSGHFRQINVDGGCFKMMARIVK